MKIREAIHFKLIKWKYLLHPRFPLYGKEDLNSNPFFILASPRSGSTLLRTILSRNENVIIPPESDDLIPTWIVQFMKNKKSQWEDVIRLLVELVQKKSAMQYWNLTSPELLEKLNTIPKKDRSLHKALETLYKMNHDSATAWGDKTPYLIFALPYLEYLFPQAKYIYLVRDGRDVVRSIMNARKDATLKNSAERWVAASRMIQKIRRKGNNKNVRIIRYEDLVINTEEVVQSICHFLSIEYKVSMLDQSNILDLGDTILPHHENTKRPIDSGSIGKWKSYFSEEQKNQLHQHLGKHLDYFNY